MSLKVKRNFRMLSFGLGAFLLLGTAFADSKIKVTVTSLSNIYGNGAMEVCGSASHEDGKKPLLVNIKHSGSSYTTLTDIGGNWCSLVKRWTYSGKVEVTASTIDGALVSDSVFSE
ncbi:MAG: hypothetical protein AB7F43_12345 [Bacteriovoracia bacterium]